MDRATRGLFGPVVACRAAWGSALFVTPRAVMATFGVDDTRSVRVAARLLGGRHLLESYLLQRGSVTFKGCRRVDDVHLLSMALLAAFAPGARRPATVSLVVGGALRTISKP